MKKTICGLSCALMLCFFCACSSLNISKAQTAYENGAYEETIALLENESLADENLVNMLSESRIRVAYSKEEYSEVISLADPGVTYSDEVQEIITLSEAQLAFSKKDYPQVIDLLKEEKEEKREDQAIFHAAVKELTEETLEKRDVSSLVELYALSAETEDILFEGIVRQCEKYDYSAFGFLDELVSELQETDLKQRLATFSEENAQLRAMAFLNADWYKKDENGELKSDYTSVKFADGVGIGIICGKFAENDNPFGFIIGDISWKNFVVYPDDSFTYDVLLRSTDGTSKYALCYATIDYSNNCFSYQISENVSNNTFTVRYRVER